MDGEPENMGDFIGNGKELGARVVGVDGVEGDVVVHDGGRKPGWLGPPSRTVNLPGASGTVWLLQASARLKPAMPVTPTTNATGLGVVWRSIRAS